MVDFRRTHDFVVFLPLLLVSLSPSLLVSSQTITVYTYIDHVGNPIEFNISSCANVPSYEDGGSRVINSVKTNGHCIHLYEKSNCHGNFIKLTPDGPFHDKLPAYDSASVHRSASLCTFECKNCSQTASDEDATAEIARRWYYPKNVTLFSQKAFKGDRFELEVNSSCTKIPDKWVNRFLSIVTYEMCIQFFSDDKCEDTYSGHFIGANPEITEYRREAGIKAFKRISCFEYHVSDSPCHVGRWWLTFGMFGLLGVNVVGGLLIWYLWRQNNQKRKEQDLPMSAVYKNTTVTDK